jgi:diaminopimelate decarboxylase
MPLAKDFLNRLEVLRPELEQFSTPFHIYDEEGIIDNIKYLQKVFAGVPGFKEYFAVKACPNQTIMALMFENGCGFDCSSIPELYLSRQVGARGEDIMFTSNNTSEQEFREAAFGDGSILNLDDISFISQVPNFPKLICFRYNPGEKKSGNKIIGNPVEAKYGVCDHKIVEAYRLAMKRGAKRFGLHTMVCSNQLDYTYMVDTVKMLLEVVERVSLQLGIEFEFINIGGGIGIPYRPHQKEFDLESLAIETEKLFEDFMDRHGYTPKLYMECGRYMTGPYGALVTTVINRMEKYRQYIGVDASMSALMRPGMYDAYHHISVLNNSSIFPEVVDVVGSLCENNDKFAKERALPITKKGDLLVIHDTGAHGHAMGFNYNGRLRPKELLLTTDNKLRLIRRAETYQDYIATLTGL